QKWEEWAAARSMAVVFAYWGAHELFERLSREEHRGRYYFWFHRELFSQEWFQSRLEEAIANVGPRYSPELDVQLPIARLFDGLGRTPAFFARLRGVLQEINKWRPYNKDTSLPEQSQRLREILTHLGTLLDLGDQHSVERIKWDRVGDVTRTAL